MAQNTDITLTADTWTLLTNSSVTSITFQNKGAYHILVKGTNSTVAPTDENGSIRYNPGQGERNVSLLDLFSGTSSSRVWAKSKKSLPVMVSHA